MNFFTVETSGFSVVVVETPNFFRAAPNDRAGLRLGTTSDSICWLSLKRCWIASDGRLEFVVVNLRVVVSLLMLASVDGSAVTIVDSSSVVSSESFASRESGISWRSRLSLLSTSFVINVDSISLETSEITVVKSEFPTALSG